MSASSNGIAGKMNAQVAAGHHPSTVELAELDGEREILWAGGVAYDLRLSAEHPEPSRTTDPGTPHLHSAGVIPEMRPTPLWDALTAAVWPDEDLRAWALRVLAIAFTGYPDKALPILLGDTDSGQDFGHHAADVRAGQLRAHGRCPAAGPGGQVARLDRVRAERPAAVVHR